MKSTEEIIAARKRRYNERMKAKAEAHAAYRARFKDCPFCGSANVGYKNNGEGSDWVQCDDCSATGPATTGMPKAIVLWNAAPRLHRAYFKKEDS